MNKKEGEREKPSIENLNDIKRYSGFSIQQERKREFNNEQQLSMLGKQRFLLLTFFVNIVKCKCDFSVQTFWKKKTSNSLLNGLQSFDQQKE